VGAAKAGAPAKGYCGLGNKEACRLQGGLEHGLGAYIDSESKWEETFSGGPSMAHGGARCAHASGRRRLLKPARGGGVRRFAADWSELWLGMGSHSAATCRNGGPMAYGGGVHRRVGVCRVAPTTGLLASLIGKKGARRMDQRTRVGLCVRVRWRTVMKPRWPGATSRAPAFPRVLGANPFEVASFRRGFLKIFELKWANI
jgi:hypothetical protein